MSDKKDDIKKDFDKVDKQQSHNDCNAYAPLPCTFGHFLQLTTNKPSM